MRLSKKCFLCSIAAVGTLPVIIPVVSCGSNSNSGNQNQQDVETLISNAKPALKDEAKNVSASSIKTEEDLEKYVDKLPTTENGVTVELKADSIKSDDTKGELKFTYIFKKGEVSKDQEFTIEGFFKDPENYNPNPETREIISASLFSSMVSNLNSWIEKTNASGDPAQAPQPPFTFGSMNVELKQKVIIDSNFISWNLQTSFDTKIVTNNTETKVLTTTKNTEIRVDLIPTNNDEYIIERKIIVQAKEANGTDKVTILTIENMTIDPYYKENDSDEWKPVEKNKTNINNKLTKFKLKQEDLKQLFNIFDNKN